MLWCFFRCLAEEVSKDISGTTGSIYADALYDNSDSKSVSASDDDEPFLSPEKLTNVVAVDDARDDDAPEAPNKLFVQAVNETKTISNKGLNSEMTTAAPSIPSVRTLNPGNSLEPPTSLPIIIDIDDEDENLYDEGNTSLEYAIETEDKEVVHKRTNSGNSIRDTRRNPSRRYR